MTPEEIAASYLRGQLRPLEAAIQILAGYGSLPDHLIWQATRGANGPLSGLYVAADEVARICYIGPDSYWWHPEARTSKQADLAKTQRCMEARVRAAYLTTTGYGQWR